MKNKGKNRTVSFFNMVNGYDGSLESNSNLHVNKALPSEVDFCRSENLTL